MIQPAASGTSISRGLILDFTGTAYSSVLILGGRTVSQIRPRLANSVNRARFAPINQRVDAAGNRYLTFQHLCV